MIKTPLLLTLIGITLLRIGLPNTGWLTEEGLKIFPWLITPFQILFTILFIRQWWNWEKNVRK